MITNTKFICIIFVLSLLFVSISNAGTIIAVSGGEYHSMVLDKYGRVYSCGDNSLNQLGREGDPNVFNRVLDGEMNTASNLLENISGIGAGWKHSLAVDSSGSVWAWGNDGYGELGNGSEGASSVPVKVHGGDQGTDFLRYITAISAGRSGEHSLAIDAYGFCYAWGRDNEGQVGVNYSGDWYSIPKKVLGGQMGTPYLQNIIAVSGGEQHSMALDSSGFVYTWGDNKYYTGGGKGKLGINNTQSDFNTTPVKVHGVSNIGYLQNITAISAGWDHCMALQDYYPSDPNLKGYVYTWGNNGTGYDGDGGRLGNGTTTNSPVPVKVMDTASGYLEKITVIGAGESHCIALDIYGNVWAWGDNKYGQLGTGSYTDSLTPVKVRGENGAGYLSNIVYISAGYWHNLAVDSNGILWVWGCNNNGNLGLGDTNHRTTPVPLPMFPPSPMIFTKTDDVNDNDCVESGDIINYTICFDGNGYSDTNVVLTDYLSDYVDFNSCTGGGDYNSTAKTVKWYIGTIGPSDTDCFNLQVRVKSTAPQGQFLTNTAKLSGDNFITQAIEKTKTCCLDPVVYVKKDAGGANNGSNWTNAYKELRDALSAVKAGTNHCAEQIWVAKGTYAPTNNVSKPDANFAMVNGIDIYGGFNGNETSIDQRRLADDNYASILSGDIDGNGTGDVYTVVTAANARLDGFTVRKSKLYQYGISSGVYVGNCSPTISNCVVKENNGYGIYCCNSANVTISNTFVNNNDYDSVYGRDSGTVINIDRCTVGPDNYHGLQLLGGVVNAADSIFSENTNSGIYALGSNLNIERCDISDTEGEYGIYCSNTNANIKRCTIQRNQGYGLSSQESSDVNVAANIISDNTYDGVYIQSGNCWLTDNLIYRNRDNGLYVECAVRIRNNTIADNCRYGIYNASGNPDVNNNIIWGSNGFYGGALANYNCIQSTSGYSGSNNINLNPRFRDPCNSDYHLDSNSPCIDRGDPTFSSSTEKDIDGENRVFDGDSDGNSIVDMGADEYYRSPADFNDDGFVNFLDFRVLANAWKTSQGQADYNDRCDLYDDNTIDYKDLEVFCQDWLWMPGWLVGLDVGGGESMMMQEEQDFMSESIVFDESPEEQQSMMAGEGETAAIYLVCDINEPNSGDEVTVQVYSDTPLFCMGLVISVTGDANITDAISTADCNEYGWDPDWPTDPYFEDDWVYISGVKWESDVDGVVGYIKFRYNSGQVDVSILEGDAFDADCEPVLISGEALTFGPADPNEQ